MLPIFAIIFFALVISLPIILIFDLIFFKKTSTFKECGFFIRNPSSRKQILFRFLTVELILLLVMFACILFFNNLWYSAVSAVETKQTYEYILTDKDFSKIINETEDKYTLNAEGQISFGISENDNIIIREYTTYTTYDIPGWKKILTFIKDSEEKSYTIFIPRNITP